MASERHAGERHPGALAVPAVRDLSPYVPGKPISELERELGIHDIVKLASNENPYGPSPRTLAGHAGGARRGLAVSGWQLSRAQAGVGARSSAVDAACLTLGNGSNDLLVLLAEAFLTPGHSAVYSQYGFAIYPLVTRQTGARADRSAGARPRQRDMPLGHDLAAMAAAIDARTRGWCSSPTPTIRPAPGRRRRR